MIDNLTFLTTIRRGAILFWALWFTVVTLSDLTNFCQQINFLPANFIFSSKNYDLVSQYLTNYGVKSNHVILGVFFSLIMWAFVTAVLFWIALFSINSIMPYFAFFISFCMTGFFMLADEFFIQYSLEHGHMLRLSLQLLCFILFSNIFSAFKNEIT